MGSAFGQIVYCIPDLFISVLTLLGHSSACELESELTVGVSPLPKHKARKLLGSFLYWGYFWVSMECVPVKYFTLRLQWKVKHA